MDLEISLVGIGLIGNVACIFPLCSFVRIYAPLARTNKRGPGQGDTVAHPLHREAGPPTIQETRPKPRSDVGHTAKAQKARQRPAKAQPTGRWGHQNSVQLLKEASRPKA